jgi:hypothetical protein
MNLLSTICVEKKKMARRESKISKKSRNDFSGTALNFMAQSKNSHETLGNLHSSARRFLFVRRTLSTFETKGDESNS